MTMPEPGDDLSAVSNIELAAVIQQHGLDAPWYGDDDERTPRAELYERRPDLKAFNDAYARSWLADQDAAGATVMLDAPASPTTGWLHALHDEALAAALAGMAVEPDFASAVADYHRTLRAHNRAKDALKVAMQREARNGAPETRLAADAGVDRMTVRKWLGKR